MPGESFKIEQITATAADAERLTGLTQTVQRDWRRHGYLPRFDGWAQYDLKALASLLFMHKMAQRNIGPMLSSQHADSVGLRIARFAAKSIDCWTGDIDRVPGETWAEKHRWLNPFRPVGDPDLRFFLWAADGTPHFTHSVDAFFNDRVSDDPTVAGAVVVLDLESMASVLLTAAGMPLLRCEVQEGPR